MTKKHAQEQSASWIHEISIRDYIGWLVFITRSGVTNFKDMLPKVRKQRNYKSYTPRLRILFNIRQLNIKKRTKRLYSRTLLFINRKPFTSLFLVLGVLFLLILIGSVLRRTEKVVQPARSPREVKIYRIGTVPKVRFQAKVEKGGVIKIVAQAAGIVSKIHVSAGQSVDQGTLFVSLASSYSGLTATSVQRQLAALNYQHVKDTFDTQKDIITKQREMAKQTELNAESLRDISRNYASATESLINLDNEITRSLQTTINNLETTNVGGINNQLILSTKQQLSQFSAAINQLSSQLAQARLQAGEENPPATLSSLQREISENQLSIQEKALSLSLETGALQLKLAQIAESLMFPNAPFAGTVERVYVSEGQSVNPGTPLLVLSSHLQTLHVVSLVPEYVARSISKLEESIIHINDKTVSLSPNYISTEATDGQLYSVLFSLPIEYQKELADKSYIIVDIPVGYPNTLKTIPFIPLDSVYQTQNSAYVFVNQNGVAQGRTIQLGTVVGEYVQVLDGLKEKDQVIVSRTVVQGDEIKIIE